MLKDLLKSVTVNLLLMLLIVIFRIKVLVAVEGVNGLWKKMGNVVNEQKQQVMFNIGMESIKPKKSFTFHNLCK